MLLVNFGGPVQASLEGLDTVLVAVDDWSKARSGVPMRGKLEALAQTERLPQSSNSS